MVTTLGLREAKELVESAPKAVREAAAKEEVIPSSEDVEAPGPVRTRLERSPRA